MSKNKLLDKIKSNSKIKSAEVLSKSKFFGKDDSVATSVPILNIALSGDVDGGFSSGLITIAGPSKHFKSNVMLIMIKAFLDKHEDGVGILYDSEFGITPDYLNSVGINPERIVHVPLENIGQFKLDVVQQLEGLTIDDNVIIGIDSIGNLASKKELGDALDGKEVADMSRAKDLKSTFRMITPFLQTRRIPMIVVNHTYDSIGSMYSTQIMSGGRGIEYSSDVILFMGRQQEKEGTEITGYNFMLGVEKSRFVKEKTRLPLNAQWGKGINKFSGLLEIGVELGWIDKPSQGWYQGVNPSTGEVLTEKLRKKDLFNDEFFNALYKDGFKSAIKERYSIGSTMFFEGDIEGDGEEEENSDE